MRVIERGKFDHSDDILAMITFLSEISLNNIDNPQHDSWGGQQMAMSPSHLSQSSTLGLAFFCPKMGKNHSTRN